MRRIIGPLVATVAIILILVGLGVAALVVNDQGARIQAGQNVLEAAGWEEPRWVGAEEDELAFEVPVGSCTRHVALMKGTRDINSSTLFFYDLSGPPLPVSTATPAYLREHQQELGLDGCL